MLIVCLKLPRYRCFPRHDCDGENLQNCCKSGCCQSMLKLASLFNFWCICIGNGLYCLLGLHLTSLTLSEYVIVFVVKQRLPWLMLRIVESRKFQKLLTIMGCMVHKNMSCISHNVRARQPQFLIHDYICKWTCRGMCHCADCANLFHEHILKGGFWF